MSGKPQAKKPTPPAATSNVGDSAATKKDTPEKSAKAAASTKVDKPDEQDPFAVDSSAETKKAIPLRPQPEKGRTHEVVCPMCETPGYTSTKAAGREVRCCNSDCLVRVFTAPELPKEAPVEEPKKSGLPTVLLAGGGLLVVALIGAGVWFFLLRPPEDPTIGKQYYRPGQYSDSDTADDSTEDDTSPPPKVKSLNDDPQTPREIQVAALKKMETACLQRDNNRSKPYCRRVTAVAYAHAGEVEKAMEQLQQMRSLRPAIPYYEIEPLVEVAWKAHRAGDSAATKQAIDTALKAASRLPTRGRSRLVDVADLAAILVSVNRQPEALTLIQKHEQSNLEGQTAAELSAMRARKQLNADAFANESILDDWVAPQTAAVIIELVARGEEKAALKWAKSLQNIEVRSEASMLWADSTLRQALSQEKQIDLAAIEAVANGLPPAGSARLNARIASRLLKAGRQSDAERFRTKAQAAMSKVAPPKAVILPNMKELVSFQLPPAEPLRIAAMAAAELAIAEVNAGNSEKSTAALKLSMQFLRGIAPSPVAIHKRLNAITDQGVKATQAEIKRVMKLDTEEEARLAFNDYRKQCTEIAEAADRRFAKQEAILLSLARAGLANAVAQEILARNEDSNVDQRESWTISPVTWQLVDTLTESGNAEAASKIQAILQAGGARRFPIDIIVRRAEKNIAAGQFKEAAAVFEERGATQISEDLRDMWRLRLSGRLLAAGKLDAALDFLGAIGNTDASFREMALWFAAAQATQAGQAPQVWELGQHASWTATELVSIYGGLIESLSVTEPPETAG